HFPAKSRLSYGGASNDSSRPAPERLAGLMFTARDSRSGGSDEVSKGDFISKCLPYCLKIVAPGRYRVLSEWDVNSATLSHARVPLSLAIPPKLMQLLAAAKLVRPDRLLLYDENSRPTTSTQNMQRYLTILELLASTEISFQDPR
ncbi:MAG TPA: hypothetical protein VGC55_02815, partial [Dokdonella sp.]